MSTLSIALKEWDLTISHLLSGKQAILLRKGGILEADNEFELEHSEFLFYPTFVHQDSRMIKPAFRAGIRTLREEPERIEIVGWGQVARIFEVPSREKIDALADLHIWDAPLLDMRFAYRPEKPLYLVVVRAFRLPEAVSVANTLEYAGCRSWVPLREEIETAGSTAAMEPGALESLVERISRTFEN